jgi:hypothetical protein
MAATIIEHKINLLRGQHEVIVQDSHGRQQHIHAGFLPDANGSTPNPQAIIAAEIAKFEQQEQLITQHIEAEVAGKLPQP